MPLSDVERRNIREFLEGNPELKIEQSPYSNCLRIRCYDYILLIHDAEVIDRDNYIEEIKQLRQDKADHRIACRIRKVEGLLAGPKIPIRTFKKV